MGTRAGAVAGGLGTDPRVRAGEHDRELLLYRVAGQVEALLAKPPPGWRVQRSGCAIQVWIGPDRQRSRRADFTIWVESNVDQHLHKAVEAHVRHTLEAGLEVAGDDA